MAFVPTQPAVAIPPPNIIIFGETGVGKSSIINLLAGTNVAGTSSGSVGYTFKSKGYNVSIYGTKFKFYDTAGLDEGQDGTVVQQEAIMQLYELLHTLSDGVSLLIFCMRGARIKRSCVLNWHFFWDIVCQRRVPVLLAITGLENEENMDALWEKNQISFTKHLMYPNSVACITTTKGKKGKGGMHIFAHEYAKSREKMMKAIQNVYRRDPWKVERTEWFKTIAETSYKSGKWGVKEIKNTRTEFGSAAKELIERKLMKKEDVEELAQLLKDK